MSELPSQPPSPAAALDLVCPQCRRPPVSHPLTPDTLTCTNPDCAVTYPRLAGEIPVIAEGGLEAIAWMDGLGDIEPLSALLAHLDGLEPGGPGWEHLFRMTMYLRAYYETPESLFGRLCDVFLPSIAAPIVHAVDLGCGVGGMALEVARQTGATVVGVEADPLALRFARLVARGEPMLLPIRRTASRFELRSITPPPALARGAVHWVCANALQPPLPAESADLVVAINFFDSTSDPWLALGQASALLREGGHLILAQPDAWTRDISAKHWLGENSESWDAELAHVGLETLEETEGLELRLQRLDRMAFDYTLHARLARRVRWRARD